MTAAPLSRVSFSEDDAGKSSAAPRYCGEIARVVSPPFNSTCSSSLAKLYPVESQTVSMISDDLVPKRKTYGSVMHQNATPPIVQSKILLSAVRTQTIPPSSKADSKPIKIGSLDHSASHCNVKIESGNIALHSSQGRTVKSMNRKRCTNNNSGRWTPSEHEAFLQGLKVYGREWKKVATCIPTRSSAQIRSHAQKYFAKVTKEQQQLLALTEQRRTAKPDESSLINDTMNSIMNNPSAVETRVCQTLALLRERYKQLENRLQQNQTQASFTPPVQTREATLGPATAALEFEQKTLRKAAVARYEKRKHENRLRSNHPNDKSDTSCARVSLVSMSSQGAFDSSDVIALSMLGGSFGQGKIENKMISTNNDDPSPNLVREHLQVTERPRKLRKIDDH